MHIGLNAHLLSSQASYRSAGINGYIYHTLRHLAEVAPPDWRFTAMVGAANRASFPGVTMRRARFDTESPARRIAWEQLIQPFTLREFDLYHALAFAGPLLSTPPTVVTIYDLSFIHHPGVLSPARRLYLRLFTGLTCRRARRVIAISRSTARDVSATLGVDPARVDVAAPGCDFERFRPLPPAEVAAFRAQKGLPDRFWLYLGTLEPRKNLPTLLEAYADLPDRPPLLLGGGKGWQYEAIFATIERRNLGGDVRWLGYLPADELPLWYNSAEAFVYPSIYEGFGLPVLEAMACGTPVIISDSSSLPEVAGGAGLCVPPYDRSAWRAALTQALHDADWRADACARGLIDARQFTWQATARHTMESYGWALS